LDIGIASAAGDRPTMSCQLSATSAACGAVRQNVMDLSEWTLGPLQLVSSGSVGTVGVSADVLEVSPPEASTATPPAKSIRSTKNRLMEKCIIRLPEQSTQLFPARARAGE
jgi:hypothetical protein